MIDIVSSKFINIPTGELSSPDYVLDNNHERMSRQIVVNGKEQKFDYLHQQRSGDCVLLNFLNTWSFLHDGQLPMGVNEARLGTINLREDEGISSESIRQIDSGLSQEDAVLLFSKIYDTEPDWMNDVLQIEGRADMVNVQMKALYVLEQLDSYPSGVCVTGLQEHSRTIIRLEGDQYAFLNPADPEGVQFLNTEQTMTTIATLMKDQAVDSNFFFFLRKPHGEN